MTAGGGGGGGGVGVGWGGRGVPGSGSGHPHGEVGSFVSPWMGWSRVKPQGDLFVTLESSILKNEKCF